MDRYSANGIRQTAMHEIGHALGLEHPHKRTKGHGGASSDFVLCASSAMAYQDQCVGRNGKTGTGEMPSYVLGAADKLALRQLYDPDYLREANSNLFFNTQILSYAEKPKPPKPEEPQAGIVTTPWAKLESAARSLFR